MRIVAPLAAAFLAIVQAAAAAGPPQAEQKPAVEFYWTEAEHLPEVTQPQGIVKNENGERIYLHKKPILTPQDFLDVRVSKTVFKSGHEESEHYTLHFQLTQDARKRLAETCGPGGDKLLAALIDGRPYGTPYYLKTRDASNFVPFAGMLTSKAKVDQIIALIAAHPEQKK